MKTFAQLIGFLFMVSSMAVAQSYPGGVGGTTPGTTGLTLWYKANSLASSTTSVTQWDNSVGSSYNLLQDGTNAVPTLQSSSNLINFNPCVRFVAASSTRLKTASMPITVTSTTTTSSNGVGSHYVVYRHNSSVGTPLYTHSNGTGGTWCLGARSGAGMLIRNRNVNVTTANQDEIRIQSIDGDTNGTVTGNINGTTISTSYASTLAIPTGNQPFWVGGQGSTGNFATDDIAEIAVYNQRTTSTRINIESYLAIKYGITKSGNYNSSMTNNTVVWDETINTGYNNNIAGIARDDNSGLYQKQSMSINTAEQQVLIGAGGALAETNILNTNTLSNNQFLVWGDNNGSRTLQNALTGVSNLNYTMGAIWKVQNTNNTGTVRVAWPQGLSNLSLIVSSDATFTDTDTYYSMTDTQTIGGVTYAYADVTLNNGEYFTFAGYRTCTTGYTTTWNGTSWSNGTPTIEYQVSFTGNYTATQSFEACSIHVTNNATVTINSGKNVTTFKEVTVDSGSNFLFQNNANLNQLTTTNPNVGNIAMSRDTNPLMRLDYTLWGAPVTGQKLLDFSPLTLTNRFYTYNTNTNLYNAVDPATTYFTPGVGYQIRTPNNHPTTPTIWTGTFTGVPNNGTYTTTLQNYGAGKRYNMVANPYPCPIDMTKFVAANSANITGTLYFWRKTNSTVTNMRWSTWNAGTFVASPGPEAYVTNPNGIIRNGQGFFVEAKNTSTSLTFDNSMRVVKNNTNQFFKNSSTTTEEAQNTASRIWLNLSSDTGSFCQQAISYIDGGTTDIDDFDAPNFNVNELLFSSKTNVTDSYSLTIQSRPMPFVNTEIIPLSYKADTAGNFTIAIDHKDGLFAENETGYAQEIYIKDNLTNSFNLINDTPYTFASTAGTFNDRFELRFVNDTALSNNSFAINQIIIYKRDNEITINSSNKLLKDITVYDITGRNLFQKDQINATETKIALEQSTNQILLFKITTTDGLVTIKKIIY